MSLLKLCLYTLVWGPFVLALIAGVATARLASKQVDGRNDEVLFDLFKICMPTFLAFCITLFVLMLPAMKISQRFVEPRIARDAYAEAAKIAPQKIKKTSLERP